MATWEQNPVYMNTAYADMMVSHDSTLDNVLCLSQF